MEITIGIMGNPREITLDVDMTATELTQLLSENRGSDQTGADQLYQITDTRGRQVLIPATALGYVIIGAPEPRRVGFNLN